jgi:tetratricopeptide (TPR) repeat protein
MRSIPVIALAGLVALSACAPRRLVVAPATAAFPDFIFPAVPPSMADPDLTTRQQQAWYLLQGGNLARSADELGAVLRRAPEFYPSQAALGYVELARRDAGRALVRFDSVLSIAGSYVPALVGRGQALLALERDEEALRSFEAALAADPSLVDVARRVEVLKFRAVQNRLTEARSAMAAGRLEAARSAYEAAIAASPGSPLLYRELAVVEQRQGRGDRALEHARKAVEIDRADPRSWTLVADLLEASGDLPGAIDALTSASALEPAAAVSARLAALRARAELTGLPEGYRAIAGTSHVTRGDLAALIGVKLPSVLGGAVRQNGVVFTDGRDHWASGWIQDVVRAGVMEIYANHTFQPAATVSRRDLAAAVSRLLELVARANPGAARRWAGARVAIADVAPGHLSYPAVSAAVASGVMPLRDGNTFQLGGPVSGAEAIATIDRLSVLSGAAVAPSRLP